MTTFYGLFQGDHDDTEDDATLVAAFSTEDLAEAFQEKLSKAHTELKREANELKARAHRGEKGIQVPYVADLYWDIRPIPFDPRDESEL